VSACNGTFSARCVGPAHPLFAAKLTKSVGRERTRFLAEYNQRCAPPGHGFLSLLDLSASSHVVLPCRLPERFPRAVPLYVNLAD
jgi:hypothetical protein